MILRILKDTSKPEPVNKHKKRRRTRCKGSPKKENTGVEASAGGIACESEKGLWSACRGECGVVREGLGLVLSQK